MTVSYEEWESGSDEEEKYADVNPSNAEEAGAEKQERGGTEVQAVTEEQFIMSMILQDEVADVGERHPPVPKSEKVPRRELVFVDERDLQPKTGVWFSPNVETTSGGDVGFPIEAEGEIENFLVVTNSTNFDVRVEADSSNLVDESYTNIAEFSNELNHISAYENTRDKYVVSVTDYLFNDRVNLQIRLNEPMTVEVFRAEIKVGRD